ncbi:hypothetical protein C440_03993 [Haloferax mucosum ATCC BAA-1512]|uniref:Uncharacterized protein n=1 Tax=Haloferax mucosum ATCC BAA-1512 TaxID=662479 RepID=M0IJC3_9EURY|nr:hypothetical protein [Haloferax mucosum]ELZ96906.1 hypothetical protein C440_03993 [Haloferax mucosum ATCC BAA-1512]
MSEPPLGSVIGDCSDVELAAILERIWTARGYETRVRLHGPDVEVEAKGETPGGAYRTVRIWITSTRTITADMTSAFVRHCTRAGTEPYVATVGRGRLGDDAHQPKLVALTASAVAVEVRETGVESFVRELANEDDEQVVMNRLVERVTDEDDRTLLGKRNENGRADDGGISRRAALAGIGTLATGGAVAYVAIDRGLVSLPTVEWSMPTPQPLSDDTALPNKTTTPRTPANATTIPYDDLKAEPTTYTGTAVTYTGRVEQTIERAETRFATIAVEDSTGRLRGDVVARWPAGTFFDSETGFRLLDTERVRIWGVVSGEGSLANSDARQYPQIDVSVLETA